jgi:hypothetical protein
MSASVIKLPTAAQNDDYPLAHTKASRMFKDGVEKLDRDSGISQRALAKNLGYKSSVVISHMASGRAPIPIERVPDFVRLIKLDAAEFLLAVLEQRYPNIDFLRILVGSKANLAKGMADDEQMVFDDLQAAAGIPLSNLSRDHYGVLKEAAADSRAIRRWLTIPELGIMDVIRESRPELVENGLDPKQRRALKEAVTAI